MDLELYAMKEGRKEGGGKAGELSFLPAATIGRRHEGGRAIPQQISLWGLAISFFIGIYL